MVGMAMADVTKVGAQVVGAREVVIVEPARRDAGFGHVDNGSVVPVVSVALEAQVEERRGHVK